MLTLRQKLVLSYVLFLAVIAAVGTYSIRSSQRVERAIDAITLDSPQAMGHAQQSAARIARHEELTIFIAMLIGIGVGVLFAAEFTWTTVRPLRQLLRGTRAIADGNLDQNIEVRSRDEIGTLAVEFNRMAVRLRELHETQAGRLTLERELSDAVLQSIFEPVIVADAKGEVVKLNRAAMELLGAAGESPATLVNSPAGERILNAVRDAVAMQQPTQQEGEAAFLPMRLRNAERSYRMRTTPMRNAAGKLIGAVTVLEDVTDLREIDRFKTGFLTAASQRISKPLQAIRMGLYTLRRGMAGELKPLQSEIVEEAHAQAEQLDELMGDLIELGELDTGARELRQEPLRPVDMVASAVQRHAAEARSRGITLEFEAYADLSYVLTDRRAQRSILDNLISNALRYTPEGGSVLVGAKEQQTSVLFFVRDGGPGISPERMPSIFARFNTGGDGKGTGLGLALVRRLVESMGGQTAAESRPGQGSTFSFTLPTAAALISRHPVEMG